MFNPTQYGLRYIPRYITEEANPGQNHVFGEVSGTRHKLLQLTGKIS